MEDSIIKKIKSLTHDVPFGNSQFQNINMSANQETNARKYRHCLLQMDQKINALKECSFRRKEIEIDIEELNEKIRKAKSFEKKRLSIQLERKEWQLQNEIKLIEDAIIEVETFYKIFKQLPTVTRQEFEAEEQQYWTGRLVKDAQLSISATGTVDVGTAKALGEIGFNPLAIQEELITIYQLNRQKVLEQMDKKQNESI